MYITVLPSIDLPSVQSRSVAAQARLGRHVLTSRGRDAIVLAIDLLALAPGSTVLMPASLCEAAFAPFVRAGLRVRLYRLDNKLEAEFDDLRAKLDVSVSAIYVNHFLGRLAPLSQVRGLCDDARIPLIEDCAHTPFGCREGVEAGSVGDVAIFSLRKFFAIPDGGALRVNRTDVLVPRVSVQSVRQMLKATSRWLAVGLASKGLAPSPLRFRDPDWFERYIYFEDRVDLRFDGPHSMSIVTKKILEFGDVEKVGASRRRNFKHWQELLGREHDIRPLFDDFDGGECPFCFPVLIESRDPIMRDLASRGIMLEPTICSPYMSIADERTRDERFEDVVRLSQQVVSLPVHQGLSNSVIEVIGARLIQSLRRQVRGKSHA